jgi:hypothetical protein
MKEKAKYGIPEISSPKRANRKIRKARGQNVKDWENLRERWPDAPVSIDGVGLVSAPTSYTGAPGAVSGGAKELQTEEIIPKRVVKKRRRKIVMDGEEVATEILNPPPTPAGHTVTAFGGGIIPGITNGGINRDAITGKVLPRIGRRILNNARITGDQNPATRVDGNNNGIIFDGTAREMPDPTPGNSVTGAMGALDKFKKNKPKTNLSRQYHRYVDETPFTGVDNLVAEQAAQVKKFEGWAAANNWNEFHKQHFDWWTFPIDRGSAGYGFKYDIRGNPLEELKQKPEYLKSLRRAAELYMKSMAWDLNKHDWIDKPNFDAGQDPTNNINGARLFKIGRSLQIHRLDDEFKSTREMVQSLRTAGFGVGNDIFWDNPDGYNKLSSYQRPGNGITGAMAGISAVPIPKALDGGKQRDMRTEDAYKKIWKDRDSAAIEFFKSGKIPQDIKVTFIPGDEESRLDYVKKWSAKNNNFKPYYAKLPIPGSSGGEAINPQIKKRMKQLNQLGVFDGGKDGSGHGHYYDQYGALITYSSTGEANEFANQIRNLRSLFWYGNTSQKHQRFDAWRRNPLVTIKDDDGKEVGVEYYFRKKFSPELAEQEMMNEFEKRIMEFFNPLDKEENQRPKHDMSHALKVVDENIKPGDYSFLRDYVLEKVDDQIKRMFKSEKDLNIRMLVERLRETVEVNDVGKNSHKINANVIKNLMDERHPELSKKALKMNPNFFDEESEFDHIPWSDEQTARGYLDWQFDDDLIKGLDPTEMDIEHFRTENGFDFIDSGTFRKIYDEELQKWLDKNRKQ